MANSCDTLTTFRQELEDGQELHQSEPATEVVELDDEVLQAVLDLGDVYNDGMDPATLIGMGTFIDSTDQLRAMQPLTNFDQQQANAVLHPLLSAFARCIYLRKEDVLRGAKPLHIRVLARGPQSDTVDIPEWHCDLVTEYDDKAPGLISRSRTGAGRLVAGLAVDLRETPTNIRFACGDFVVGSVVPEPEGIKDYRELSVVSDPVATIVSRKEHSIIEVKARSFQPEPDSIETFPNTVLTDLSTATLHAGTDVPDTLRVSLQFLYTDRPEAA